ncbi:molybdopterin cofactor-binding domain-containing protein [Herbaspirillum chlorophenolicum]|uniref:xanthine dehydrogenase family protein molybdopterin-binding subunit n=2 Tax=Herbaspirillum chlorophenolicum TaxID=211589 RepID=UPI003F75A137
MASFTLAIGFGGGIAHAAPSANSSLEFSPNAFIRVGADGNVTVVSSYLEMGQGTFTGIATLAAEELDLNLGKVQVVAAPADVKKYANPVFAKNGFIAQATGGSTAMAGAWFQIRKAAATARVMLLSAAAKQWKVPVSELSVQDGVVIHAATGKKAHYGAFIAGASKEPVPSEVAVKDIKQFNVIGKRSTRRIDIPEKVNGTAIYTQDFKLPGMLVAVVAYPPKLWGKVKKVNASKAKAIPGVIAVVQYQGDDEVQAGVAVLAKNTWIARQGRDALEIEWDDSESLKASSTEIFQKFRSFTNQPGVVAKERGTVLDKAPAGGKVLEAIYEQPYLAHSPMEPMNCLVHLQANRCDIWNGEQWHTGDSNSVAKELGFSLGQVTLHQLYAGGSFGRRANPRSDFVRQAVRIAKAARAAGVTAPVKLVWMREDDMRGVQYRPLTVHKVRAILDGSGNLVSWHQHIVGQSFGPLASPTAVDGSLVEGAHDTGYFIPNFRVDQHSRSDFPIPVAWIRSVGHTHSAFAVETMIDEVAAAANKDPLVLRRELLRDSPRDLAVLNLAAEKSGWGKPLAAAKNGGRRGRGIAVHESFHTHVAQVAEVTLYPDGSFTVDRVVCAVDCGVVINPDNLVSQVEGGITFGMSFLKHGITFKDGHVVESNFHDYPVVRMNSMPKVEVYAVASNKDPSGIGEPGTPPTAPAIVNALTSITGKRIRTLPLDSNSLVSKAST